jgi:Fe-S cluster assembly protein SufD
VTSLAPGPVRAPFGLDAVDGRISASPDWLAARRRAAWDAFESLAMPSSRQDEDWRRTDISSLNLGDFHAKQDSVDAALVAAARQQRDRTQPEAVLAIDAAGASAPIEGSDPLVAQGAIVTTLEDASARHADLVQHALAGLAVDETKFVALWNALWSGGVFIHVPSGAQVSLPVWIAHLSSAPGAAVFPSTVVTVEPGGRLTLIETFASPADDTAMLSNAITLLNVGRDAQLDYIAVQQWGDGVWHMATQRAVLGANARLRFFGATFGARLQKAYWEAVLQGTGAEADIAGICFGDGAQHLDHQSLQAHVGRETRSDLLLKVAVRDRARSVYSGLIDVAPSAVHADGYVQNRNLILSHGAKADSVPRLEIRANDVRCGHGATAGHIDDEQRFYFMSRGVPRADADALVVRGFMEDVLHRVPLDGVRELLAEMLDVEIAGRSQAGLMPESA